MEISKEEVLKIVDRCFHLHASSFRNDAKIEASKMIDELNEVKKLTIPIVSENKPMDEDYPLIPMKDIEDEARLIAVRWHENATDWIGDKHKLASDIMNYARRKSSANAR